jgi:hypothetical protein
VAVGSMTKRWPGAAGAAQYQGTPGSTSSSSFADLPTPVTFTFNKRRTDTQVRMGLGGSVWLSGGADASVEFAIEFDSAAYGATTQTVAYQYLNSTVDVHMAVAGMAYLAGGAWGSGMPAAVYTCSVQWRRFSGTGVVQANGDDRISADCQEVAPA